MLYVSHIHLMLFWIFPHKNIVPPRRKVMIQASSPLAVHVSKKHIRFVAVLSQEPTMCQKYRSFHFISSLDGNTIRQYHYSDTEPQ